MQVELIETFLDLCETHSFNATAERLGVTQSTVSGRVKALERSVGRRLFTRSRSGTSLTLEGLRFEPHARELRVGWEEALRSTQDTGPNATKLRIGLQQDMAASQTGAWVGALREAMPQIALHIEADFSVQMSRDLVRGILDLGIVYSPQPHPDLHFETLSEIRQVMISTEASQLSEIDPQRYFLNAVSPAFERLHNTTHPRLSNGPVSCGQTSIALHLLESMGGTAYVVEETARNLVESGRYRLVENAPVLPQPVYGALHLRNRHRSSHKRLMQVLGHHLPGVKPADKAGR